MPTDIHISVHIFDIRHCAVYVHASYQCQIHEHKLNKTESKQFHLHRQLVASEAKLDCSFFFSFATSQGYHLQLSAHHTSGDCQWYHTAHPESQEKDKLSGLHRDTRQLLLVAFDREQLTAKCVLLVASVCILS